MAKTNYAFGPVSQTYLQAIDTLNSLYDDVVAAMGKSDGGIDLDEDVDSLTLAIHSVKGIIYGFLMENIKGRKELVNNPTL